MQYCDFLVLMRFEMTKAKAFGYRHLNLKT